jgi:hypothetical protein
LLSAVACSPSHLVNASQHAPHADATTTGRGVLILSTGTGDCSVDAAGHPGLTLTVYNPSLDPLTHRVHAGIRIGHASKTYPVSAMVTVPPQPPGGASGSITKTFTLRSIKTRQHIHCLP